MTRERLPQYLSSPGLDHELSGQLLRGSGLQGTQVYGPIQWVSRHNLPVMEITQAEGLPLHACMGLSAHGLHV